MQAQVVSSPRPEAVLNKKACCRALAPLFSTPCLALLCVPAYLHTGLNLRELTHDGQHGLHGAPWPQVRLVAHQDDGDPGERPTVIRDEEAGGDRPAPWALPITWAPSLSLHSPVGSIWFGSERQGLA